MESMQSKVKLKIEEIPHLLNFLRQFGLDRDKEPI